MLFRGPPRHLTTNTTMRAGGGQSLNTDHSLPLPSLYFVAVKSFLEYADPEWL